MTAPARSSSVETPPSSTSSAAIPRLVAKVQLGTPAQDFLVHLDTGSAVFWVRSADCASAAQCRKTSQAAFNKTLSSTFAPLGNQTTNTITYADGTTVGCVTSQDTLSIGGIALRNRPFCLADTIVSKTALHDGIIGLAPPSVVEETNVFSALTSAAGFKAQQVGFWYNTSDIVDGQIQSGAISFGGPDPLYYSGDVSWLQATIATGNHWGLPVNNLTLADGTDLITAPTIAIVDSGSTFNYLPPALFNRINLAQFFNSTNFDGAGTYVMNCSLVDKLTTFTIRLSGVEFKIPPEQQYFKFRDYCVITFTTSSTSTLPPILGIQFLKSHYTVFDYKRFSIGFAGPPSAGTALGSGGSSGSQGNGTSSKNTAPRVGASLAVAAASALVALLAAAPLLM
ncbi:hypothetical protein HK105_201037 [Polyrhizophydium stewartii]|uniref:Peptidase A1 domain-containing protein n=1 Tax=Polyrhizophydium stewartii TaxID=2732419 RepID=A0ABR4NIP0_9FUNG